MLLDREESCLLIVDVQERLTPVMTEPRRVLRLCPILMRAAARLGIPVVVSEQYPQGLGPTMVDLREFLPPEGAMAKMHFSAAADPEISARVKEIGRKQVVIAGIEAHVCVLQTALGFLAQGYQPFVVADACASRRKESEDMAFARLRQSSVTVITVEMALFEWLHQAGTSEFKELSALIR